MEREQSVHGMNRMMAEITYKSWLIVPPLMTISSPFVGLVLGSSIGSIAEGFGIGLATTTVSVFMTKRIDEEASKHGLVLRKTGDRI